MNVGFRAFFLSTIAIVSLTHHAAAQSSPIQIRTPNIISVAGSTQVSLGGQTFVNSGLLGMGRLPTTTRDFNGDTLGAFSGMDIDLSTWRKTGSGYTGTLYSLPDRGPNGIGSVDFSDYAGRLSTFSMAFTPYTGTANLPAATSSQNQLVMTQTGGFFLRDFNGNVTTGFDPGTGAASVITQNGIQLPGQSTGAAAGKIALDAEAVRFLRDRSFYVSDEYGANVYYFDKSGRLQGVIRPPAALLPRDAAGNLSYSSLVNPTTGRRPNQGLEGMAVTPDGKKLVTLLQSAAMQDSPGGQQNRTNTRLMIYDITASKTPTAPVAEYVMQLPTYTFNGNGGAVDRTAAQSELLALNDNQFLVLARDGLGLGLTTGNPVFKSVMLVDVTGATNIAGTTFQTTTTPISPGGALASTIRPVQQVELVNMLNATQLTKFGENLNNVTPNRLTLGEKWEGMALSPVLEESAPQDFLLFVGNDNDFLSTQCSVNNQNCAQSVDSDSHVLVYRLSLPTYVDPEYRAAMVDGGPIMLETLGQSAQAVAKSSVGDIAAQMNAARRAGWTTEGLAAWVSGVYRDSDYDDFRIAGVKAQSESFRGTVGFDYGLSNVLSLGLTVGYGESDMDAGAGFSAKTEGYNLGATLRISKNDLFVNAGYTQGDLNAKDITRPGAYGLTAIGETDGESAAGFVEAGIMFPMGAAKLGPVIGYRHVTSKFEAYVETGAAGGNIAVPEHKFTSNIASYGAEATFALGDLVPVIHAAYNQEFSDEPRTLTLKLASATAAMASETVAVRTTNEDFISTGVGLQGNLASGLWQVGYTAEFGRDDRFDHVVRAGLGFQF